MLSPHISGARVCDCPRIKSCGTRVPFVFVLCRKHASLFTRNPEQYLGLVPRRHKGVLVAVGLCDIMWQLFYRCCSLRCSNAVLISLGDIWFLPTRSEFAIFSEIFQFLVQCTKMLLPRGGGMCMLFEICEKRLFQKCMGWGGG